MESGRGKRTIDFINIGKIAGIFGILGEVKVKILTDFPERFLKDKHFYLKVENKNPEKITVENARYHHKTLLIKINGVNDIDSAKKINGALIQIPVKEAKKLPPDTFYQFQILGLAAYSNDNKYLGKITEIINTPNHDVYLISGGEKEILIPAFKKYIKKIDVEKKEIIVEIPEEY